MCIRDSRLTGGGADVSYEVTGVPVVLGQALAAVSYTHLERVGGQAGPAL